MDTTLVGYDVRPVGRYLRPVVILVPAVLGILGAETLLFHDIVFYGLVTHLAAIVFCTLALHWFETERDVLNALVLIPVFRIVNLGIPILTDLTLVWLLLVYAPFLPCLFWYAGALTSIKIGWVGRPLEFVLLLPIVTALGVLLASVEFQILQPEALIPVWHPQNLLVMTVVMTFFVALVEELMFRGIVQGALVDRYGAAFGILVASLLFGATHAGYGSPDEIAFAIGMGLVLGITYHLSRSLAAVVIAHGLVNVLVFAVYPHLGPFVTGI